LAGVGEEGRRLGDWMGQGVLLGVRWVRKSVTKMVGSSNLPETARAWFIRKGASLEVLGRRGKGARGRPRGVLKRRGEEALGVHVAW